MNQNNAVRLQLHALAYNPGNFMRTLALPEAVKHWSPTSLREKLVKIVDLSPSEVEAGSGSPSESPPYAPKAAIWADSTSPSGTLLRQHGARASADGNLWGRGRRRGRARALRPTVSRSLPAAPQATTREGCASTRRGATIASLAREQAQPAFNPDKAC